MGTGGHKGLWGTACKSTRLTETSPARDVTALCGFFLLTRAPRLKVLLLAAASSTAGRFSAVRVPSGPALPRPPEQTARRGRGFSSPRPGAVSVHSPGRRGSAARRARAGENRFGLRPTLPTQQWPALPRAPLCTLRGRRPGWALARRTLCWKTSWLRLPRGLLPRRPPQVWARQAAQRRPRAGAPSPICVCQWGPLPGPALAFQAGPWASGPTPPRLGPSGRERPAAGPASSRLAVRGLTAGTRPHPPRPENRPRGQERWAEGPGGMGSRSGAWRGRARGPSVQGQAVLRPASLPKDSGDTTEAGAHHPSRPSDVALAASDSSPPQSSLSPGKARGWGVE